MSTLPCTIDRALDNIGNGPRDVLLETLNAFEYLGLPDEERVSAIATAVAASAVSHHEGHIAKFLDAVRIWALESAGEHSPALPRIRSLPMRDTILEAADLLSSGLDTLLVAMFDAQVQLQDRVIAELTLFTRPLGQHDVHTIMVAISSVADAVANIQYQAGDVVAVPLRDPSPVGRGAHLALVQARGVA